MLVRTSAREHEPSVRTALGAGRHRLARLIVTDCLTLTGLAGLFGLLVARFSIDLVGLVAPELRRIGEVRLGVGGVVFAFAAAATSGGLISLATLWSVLARSTQVSIRPASTPSNFHCPPAGIPTTDGRSTSGT